MQVNNKFSVFIRLQRNTYIHVEMGRYTHIYAYQFKNQKWNCVSQSSTIKLFYRFFVKKTTTTTMLPVIVKMLKRMTLSGESC